MPSVAQWIILAVAIVSALGAITSAYLTARGNDTLHSVSIRVAKLEGAMEVVTKLVSDGFKRERE